MTAWPGARHALAVVTAFLLVAGVVVAAGRTGARAVEIHKVAEARFEPQPGQPFFALVVGSDGRPGLEGERGDALHVIGVNPAEGRATILNIPRDVHVDIPGRGRDRVNAALYFGGPPLQAQAVGALTGTPISFVITTTFVGFSGMVDELGGVVVDVPFAMNDRLSGAVFPQGPVLMNGQAALAFARNRYIPDGDIRRSEHQAVLIVAGLAKLRAETTGPFETLKLLGVLARHTRLDGVGLRDLYGLGRLALSIDPANVRSVTVPTRAGRAGGAEVLFAAPPADALFADFRDDAILQSH